MTHIFLRRPILAIVISLIIMLCGIVALFNLPISQFPDISPPSISINASYPGSNAETAAKVVAAQIENQMVGLSNLLYMSTTTSSAGTIDIHLTYEVGTNLDYAINEVLNRLYAAMPLLPNVVQKLGIIARKSSPDMLLIISFYSTNKLDTKFVANYLKRTVENDLLLLPEVGSIQVFGSGEYAIRVWLNPNQMQRYAITTMDIASAIRDQNVENFVGKSNAPPNVESNILSITLKGNAMYSRPEQIANVILRNTNNQIIQIKDVARVELGSVSYSTIGEINFRDKDNSFKHYTGNFMLINATPGANQLEARNHIMNRLAQDAKSFPSGLFYKVTIDNSRFVRASVNNVFETLIIAFFLVACVIFLFLRNIRSSLVAIMSIPISVLGTMACLYVVGFSLNTLSLFALVLSIGIVVDDAIVIIENIERLRHEYPTLPLIKIIGMTLDEVRGAVIAIVLVLSVVFVPAMCLSGLSGNMFRQFAVTIACAVILSGICALTFTPAMSLIVLRTMKYEIKSVNLFDKFFTKITHGYVNAARWFIQHKKSAIIIWVIVCCITVGIFTFLPRGFVPNEDQGLIFASVNLPSSSSLIQTRKRINNIVQKLTTNPAIDSIVSVVGWDFLDAGTQKTYSATIFMALKQWNMRTTKNSSSNSIINDFNALGQHNKDLVIRAFNQPVIRGLSTTGGVEFYIEDRLAGDPRQLQIAVAAFIKRLMKHKEIVFAFQTLDTNTLETSITPDMARVATYGINLNDLYTTLATLYSNNNVNYAYMMQGLVWVIMQVDYPFRSTIEKLNNTYIRNNNTGLLVPLGSVVHIKAGRNAQVLQRFNGYVASKVTVIVIPIFSAGQIMNIIQQEIPFLDKKYNYEWAGTSYQLLQSQKTAIIALIFSVIMIYLVLAALYEMWRLPLVVMMGIPFALFGAGIILLITFKPNDLYFQISLLALLGLSAKNIILLIEFALQHMKAGYDVVDSILFALQVRFRPIVMTSTTFILGTLPLVLATGAGANAQHSVGIGIIGGVLGSVLFATLLVPTYFVIIMQHYKFVEHKE